MIVVLDRFDAATFFYLKIFEKLGFKALEI